MKIRQLYAYELRPAAALVMETYSRMEQPYVANPKEIEDFKRYADEDHLWVESCKNKLFLFGAFDDNDQMVRRRCDRCGGCGHASLRRAEFPASGTGGRKCCARWRSSRLSGAVLQEKR